MSSDEKKQLGRIALQQRAVPVRQASAVDQLKVLSEKFGVPGVDLKKARVRLSDLELIPVEIARRHVILPFLVDEERLFVAMGNPQDRRVLDELEFVTNRKVFPYVAPPEVIADTLEQAYRMRSQGEQYFTGPDAPAETGARPPRPPSLAPRPQPPGPDLEVAEVSDAELEAVVGDAMGRISEESEIPSEDFGNLGEEVSHPAEAVPEPPKGPSAPRKTVLVVDDEDDIRRMLERLLSAKGYRVISTSNGREALSLVKDHTPDVIILDAMLPEIHGFDIARRIKAAERYRHIPIVMVSAVYKGWRFAEDLRESCGVEHYIEKPFKIGDVVSAVEQSLSAPAGVTSAREKEISAEAEAELNAGVAAYQEGRLEDAIAHLKRGVGIDPLAYRLRFHLGLLHGRKGEVYDAISELERAVEINSRHFPALRNLAILYQKAGFRNRATEMWQRALTVAPDDATRQSIKQHLLGLL